MIEQVQVYRTSDGELFESKEEALKHQYAVDRAEAVLEWWDKNAFDCDTAVRNILCKEEGEELFDKIIGLKIGLKNSLSENK